MRRLNVKLPILLCLGLQFFTFKFLNARAPGSTLEFDGKEQYVDMGDWSDLDMSTSDFTLSAWIYPQSLSNNSRYAIINKKEEGNGNPGYGVRLLRNNVEFVIGDGTANSYGISSNPISIRKKEWTNITVVFDRSMHQEVRIFVNGKPEPPVDISSVSGSINNPDSFRIGAGKDGSSGRLQHFFKGKIDEVRIWKDMLTTSEIRKYMCRNLQPASQANLTGYWKLNSNSGNTAFDETGNNLHGTLKDARPQNGNNLPSWITSGIPLGDKSAFLYTSNWSGKNLSLAHPGGDSIIIGNITTSNTNANGIQLYRVDSPFDVPGPPGNLKSISKNRYWGIYFIDGKGLNWDFTYMYQGHPGITSKQELDLASREDYTANSWKKENAVLDTVANTLIENSYSGVRREFILGIDGNSAPLPVELVNFSGKKTDSGIRLQWITASEINSRYFAVQRANDQKAFRKIARIPAAGFSTETMVYTWMDPAPYKGVNYYRLKQVDNDQSVTFSPVIRIYVKYQSKKSFKVSLLENPFRKDLRFLLRPDKSGIYTCYLIDCNGKQVNQKMTVTVSKPVSLELNTTNLEQGLYFLIVEKDEHRSMKQVIKN